MKKVLLTSIFFLSNAIAQQYSVYNLNGKYQGAFNGKLNKQKLSELTAKYHSTVLIKTNDIQDISITNKLNTVQINNITRTINIKKNLLSDNLWLEVDKNEIIKICIDHKVAAWETSLNSTISSDSCLFFKVPTLIGTESINMFLPESDSSHRINLAIGMKYLNFKNDEVLLGFDEQKNISSKKEPIKYNESGFPDFPQQMPLGEWSYFGGIVPPREKDYKRLVSISGSYLIDKYPVTNCEFIQQMWYDIPDTTSSAWYETMVHRKTNSLHNGTCTTNDSAANYIFTFQAMKYANARSIRDGLTPYYKFSFTGTGKERITSKDQYIIIYSDFVKKSSSEVVVSIDRASDGYRLPFYNEWMMFARGGDKKNRAPWGDSANYKEVLKYARFGTGSENREETEPVGQLQPNGYGLYDTFGLVWELVLLEKSDSYYQNTGHPYCRKGGDNYIGTRWGYPRWENITYGYSEFATSGGFRLIRNIGNNAKWSEVKSDKE